ncbi:TetR/AcrR family transcriptional regulator [Leeia oryzae]|uniref:TetR/AcrR family transcriptional regulator n=1 Tax=Leeia oryzae TaxID=356662 RepID=UPI00035D62D1|nr:TetR/AcrR family transcriptional regulator [Leeia oryzae]
MTRATHHTDTREHLLATAERIILGKGFAAVGLAEILQTAGVPKGSFYHYFKSKEGFGVDLLERYFEQYDERLKQLFVGCEGTARERLLKYFAGWLNNHACSAPICLAVKLAAEVSDLSEPMREALSEGMDVVMKRLSVTILDGQADGSLSLALDAEKTARSLYSLWVGATLLYKVQQTLAPLEFAMQQTEMLLAAPATK